MKTPLLASSLLGMMAAIGCQEPCTKTALQPDNFRDTIIVERSYADCNDTLNYHEVQMRKDSTVLADGEVQNGKREGIWILNRWRKEIVTYEGGFEVNIKEFDRNDLLSSERTFTADSLYFEQQFNQEGRVILNQFLNLEGYLTGHGITYDSLGRKTSEGEHISEPCLVDTVYIESPDPPYDLQMTIIEELGGRHGPWVYYDSEGNVTDTIMFDHGVQFRESDRFKTGFHQNGLEPEGVKHSVEENPDALLGGRRGGALTKGDLLQSTISCSDNSWKVNSFDLVIPFKGERVSFPCEANAFSERAKTAIASLKVGDEVRIELIRATNGKEIRKCTPLHFTISAAETKKPEPIGESIREFEGRVTYRVDVEYAIIRSEGWQITPVGTKREIFYKQGNWLHKSNGRSFVWQLYLRGQNKFYTGYDHDVDLSIVWTAGGYHPDFAIVLKVEVNEHAETILGHDCDQVILYTKNDTSEYFYSHDLPLDFRHFEKCRGLHFNVWTRYAQAVPLKMVFASKSMGKQKYSLTATNIQPLRIDDRVFTMPIDGQKMEADWSDGHMEFISKL